MSDDFDPPKHLCPKETIVRKLSVSSNFEIPHSNFFGNPLNVKKRQKIKNTPSNLSESLTKSETTVPSPGVYRNESPSPSLPMSTGCQHTETFLHQRTYRTANTGDASHFVPHTLYTFILLIKIT